MSAIWIAVMVAIVGIAPIGKHVSYFSVLFLLGNVLMILMAVTLSIELLPCNSQSPNFFRKLLMVF